MSSLINEYWKNIFSPSAPVLTLPFEMRTDSKSWKLLLSMQHIHLAIVQLPTPVQVPQVSPALSSSAPWKNYLQKC
jgi:hypothetical protein